MKDARSSGQICEQSSSKSSNTLQVQHVSNEETHERKLDILFAIITLWNKRGGRSVEPQRIKQIPQVSIILYTIISPGYLPKHRVEYSLAWLTRRKIPLIASNVRLTPQPMPRRPSVPKFVLIVPIERTPVKHKRLSRLHIRRCILVPDISMDKTRLDALLPSLCSGPSSRGIHLSSTSCLRNSNSGQ